MADELNLSNLQPAQPRKDRKRVGRGLGSGKGRYSGRGLKGRSRAPGRTRCRPASRAARCRSTCGSGSCAGTRPPDAMPIGPSGRTPSPSTSRSLEARFDAGAEVTPESLKAAGLIRKLSIDVKVLGEGELTKKLSVSAHGVLEVARSRRSRPPAEP